MPEALVPGDLEEYLGGSLANAPVSQTDPAVVRCLNAALVRVRRHCHWHVSPVQTDTLTFVGEGQRRLVLPTLKPLTATATEDGVPVATTLAGLMLAKADGSCWHGAVEVELTHGYTAAEAEDWREAVLAVAAATMRAQRNEGLLTAERIDDVERRWVGGSLINADIAAQLAPYVRLQAVAG